MQLRVLAGACLATMLNITVSGVAAAQDLYLVNGRIVDPATRDVRTANLLIRDGVIVGEQAEPPAEFSGDRIDITGKWVIPGLNDLHTHSYGNMAPGRVMDGVGTAAVAQRALYAGVTGFLDLFGLEQSMFELRRRQRAGEVGGADLFASLSCLTATNGHCTEYGIPTRTMDTPEEARQHVRELVAKEADVIKIVYAPTGRMPSIDRATLEAAVATANELDVRTIIHVSTWDDVRHAVAVGASAVTHVPFGPIPPDLASIMAAQRVYSIPTLAVELDYLDFVTDSTVLNAVLARSLTTEEVLDAYRGAERGARLERLRTARPTVLQSVKAMHDAGVPILLGTDAGNFGTLQGYSVHRELILLVEAGLSAWDALAAGTTRAGEFMRRPWGVSPGDQASLIVLDASPLENIRNTQRIALVIHRGTFVDREALERY